MNDLTPPNPETTPLFEMIMFTRAVAFINGDTEHPIQGHLDSLEETLHVLENSFQSNAYFK